MSSGLVTCVYCYRTFLKDIRYINENNKLGHNFFCSSECQYTSKSKQKTLTCEKSSCKNTFRRAPHSISPHNFCSRSCSAIFSNTKRGWIKIPKKKLTEEERKNIQREAAKQYWSTYKYKYSKEDVIDTIRSFVKTNDRLPVKRELNKIYKSARKYFETWNNAIKAAGFEPNPVLFAKRQIANDGHICDSIAEKMIDDYLCERGIIHERNISYPEGVYTADFKIGDRIVEYFGLAGEHKRYDELRLIKQMLAKKYKLKLVEIYPKDLYSKGRDLDEIMNL